jgi:hypothetical protein
MERSNEGKFLEGNTYGKGRPRQTRPAIPQAIPQDELNRVLAVAIDQAQQGDAQARSWLLEYERFRLDYYSQGDK